jgi:uncharacterized protein YbjT (DUF2867 family)
MPTTTYNLADCAPKASGSPGGVSGITGMTSEILITGATGNVGSQLLKVFSQNNVPVQALVRRRDPAKQPPMRSVEYVEADLTKPYSLADAFKGVRTLFLILPLVPNMVDIGCNAVDAARKAGVRYLVKMSVMLPEDSPIKLYQLHREIENHIEATGLDCTFLRPNSFYQNYINICGKTIRSGNVFYLPLADARVSLIDTRDIASTAFKILTTDIGKNQAYELTGPESLTNEDVADSLTKVLGKRISYAAIDDDAATNSMSQAGISYWLINILMELYHSQRKGNADLVSDSVQDLTGKAPIPFQQFAWDHISAFTPVPK